MNILKRILNKIRKFNQELNQNDGMTWLTYRQQWLEENKTKCN